MADKFLSYPRIFASDGVAAGQRVDGAQSDIAEIANRGGDNIEAR